MELVAWNSNFVIMEPATTGRIKQIGTRDGTFGLLRSVEPENLGIRWLVLRMRVADGFFLFDIQEVACLLRQHVCIVFDGSDGRCLARIER